jgi:hypothetical protein
MCVINVGDNFNNTDEDRNIFLLSTKDIKEDSFTIDKRNVIFRDNKLYWIISNKEKGFLRIQDMSNWDNACIEKKIGHHFKEMDSLRMRAD